MNNKNTAKALYKVLSNTYSLALKTQNYHWNITGSDFKSLHEMFGSQYEELFGAIDEIAERIRALEIKVTANFTAFNKESKIKDGDEKNNSVKMLEELFLDQKTLIEIISDALKICQKEGDEASADMLINRLEVHGKNSWMLKSSL